MLSRNLQKEMNSKKTNILRKYLLAAFAAIAMLCPVAAFPQMPHMRFLLPGADRFFSASWGEYTFNIPAEAVTTLDSDNSYAALDQRSGFSLVMTKEPIDGKRPTTADLKALCLQALDEFVCDDSYASPFSLDGMRGAMGEGKLGTNIIAVAKLLDGKEMISIRILTESDKSIIDEFFKTLAKKQQ